MDDAVAEELREIKAELRRVVRLLALKSVSDEMSLKEKASRLNAAGFPPKEIAEFLNTTPNNVSVALSAVRRERAAAKPKTSK